MIIAGHTIGVCSWSLQPKDCADLAAQVQKLNLQHVQLALAPLLQMSDSQATAELATLARAGIQLTAGMLNFADEDYASIEIIKQTGGYVPDKLWPARKDLSIRAACRAAEMGLKMVSVHIGFVPHSGTPGYLRMMKRMSELAMAFADAKVDLLMETGQEPAAELLRFIKDLDMRNVFVNFDPANMILYGAGNPIEAIRILGPHIRHLHIKDGAASARPGVEWGEEVPFGTGQVPPETLLRTLKQINYTGVLAIEREAGTTRLKDIQFAIETLRKAASAVA